jgi:opacity protein-like surface antigen
MPRWGKVGKQRIVDEGPLAPFPDMTGRQTFQQGRKAKYDMWTFDEVLVDRSKAFMDQAKRDNKPFFIWHNTTRMHAYTFLSQKYQAMMNPNSNYGLEEGGMAQLDDDIGVTIFSNPCLPFASCPTVTTTNAVLTNQEKLPWFGTVRGRLGLTPSDPRWLVYATGGLAYGEIQSNGSVTFGGATATGNTNTTKAGWTVGAGIEGVLSGNWTAKLEYLFVDFGNVTNTYTGVVPVTPIATSSHITDNILRVGLSYNFH